jgi:hypothetical protein
MPLSVMSNGAALRQSSVFNRGFAHVCAPAKTHAQRNSPCENFFREKCRYERVERHVTAQNAQIDGK